MPSDYWKELVRAPYALIAVGTLGAYLAHPYMQAGAALVENTGLVKGGILDPPSRVWGNYALAHSGLRRLSL